MKDHDPLITAARDLRKRVELLKPSAIARPELGPELAQIDTLFCSVLTGIEDLADRVTLLEKTQRQLLERLEFVSHVTRMLGGIEDWTVPDPDQEPGALVTEAQAIVPGASGPASSFPPTGSPAS